MIANMKTIPPVKDNDVKLPAFFDQHPEVRDKVVEYLKTIPREQKKRHVEEFEKYLEGEMTWGEIIHITKGMQKEIARVAYLKFKMGDFARAETLFKGLAIIDHTSWYYRAALGAIFQKQKKYHDACVEYTAALELKENEASCLVNRGECLMMQGQHDQSRADLNAVIQSGLVANNPWMMRAKVMLKRLELIQKPEEAPHE